jgi:hypothetical protein
VRGYAWIASWSLLVLALGSACQATPRTFDPTRVADTVWAALEPNTSSHNRENWVIGEAAHVVGQEIAAEFENEPAPGCFGPEVPPNPAIDPTAAYWYVQARPRPATALPQAGTPSPTAPPLVPEPFMYQALFLLDASDGRVVARRLYCVIY